MLITLFNYGKKVNVPYFKHLVRVTFEGLNVLANLYTFLAYVYIVIVQICYCKMFAQKGLTTIVLKVRCL